MRGKIIVLVCILGIVVMFLLFMIPQSSHNKLTYINAETIHVEEINGVTYHTKVLDEQKKTICITKILTNKKNISIPESIKGYKVVQLGEYIKFFDLPGGSQNPICFTTNDAEALKKSYCLFNDVSNIESVQLPSTLERIGICSFYACGRLNKIIFSNQLREIGEEAFRGCKSLTKIIIPKNIHTIFPGAFENCTKVKTVSIFSEKTNIHGRVFAGISGKIKLSSTKTANMIGIFSNWVQNKKKIDSVMWNGSPKKIEVEEETFDDCYIRNLIIPASVKRFTMWQQKMMLCDYLVITGNDTIVSNYTNMGIDPKAYYINAKAIVALKGAKVLKYSYKFKYPMIDEVDWKKIEENPILNDDEYYTEQNIDMGKIKVITVTPPKQVNLNKNGAMLKWNKVKGSSKYWIYYSPNMKKRFKKIAVIKSNNYKLTNKGYYKVRSIKHSYGVEWKGRMSKSIVVY